MNENKNTNNTGKPDNNAFNRLKGLTSKGKLLALNLLKWLRKEIVIVIGALLIVVITLTITQATPQSRWLAAPSTYCLSQATGNSMIENNGLIYVLFGGSTNFRSFDPATGDCSSTALTNFPSSANYATKLFRIDDDTLFATIYTSSSAGYFYHIRDNFWSYYNRSKADDSSLPAPIPYSGVVQGDGNSIVSYNNELYIANGGGLTNFLKYSPATNSWTTLSGIPNTISTGSAMIYPGSGNYIYLHRAYNSSSFFRYDISGNSWSIMASSPSSISSGGGSLAAIGSNDLYMLGGSGTKQFWKYDITGNSWTDLTDTYPLPDIVGGGGALIGIGNTLYALQGNMTDQFWALDLSAGTPAWEIKTKVPNRVFAGGSLTTDGTYIYATKGKATGIFYRYDPTLDSWSILEPAHTIIGISGTSESTAARGGLAYVAVGPSGGPEIYMSTGLGGTSRESLARYVISSNSWPVYYAPPQTPGALGYGASGAHVESSDEIFVTRGANTSDFWKYIISRNLFLPSNTGKFDTIREIATSIPGLSTITQGTGSSVTLANGKIYHLVGNSSYFLEYDPAGNSWTQLPNTPVSIGYASLTAYDENTLFVASNNNFWKYDIPSQTWFSFNIGKTVDGKPISQNNYFLGDNEYNLGNYNQSYGTHIVYHSGDLYYFRGGGSNYFASYKPSLNRWIYLPNMGYGIYAGGSSVAVGNYIYTAPGSGSTFRRFNPATGVWDTMSSTPDGMYYGGKLAATGGDFIYAIHGNATNFFSRYSISANSWTNLSSTSPLPYSVRVGGNLTALNSTTLYAMSGNGMRNFMRFDITDSPSPGDGVWTDLSTIDPLPDGIGSGAGLTSDGTYLYITKGRNTPTFWRYDPSGSAGSRWSVLPDMPVNMGATASLTSSTDAYGDLLYVPELGDIYALPGNGYTGFSQNSGNGPGLLYRYQLPASSGPPADDNTWPYFPATPLPPASVSNGVSLTHPEGSEYIYGLRGNSTTHFWRYHVPTEQWEITYQSILDDDSRLSQGNVSQSQNYGNSIVEADGDFFVLNGVGTNFQKFDPTGNSWTTLANTPGSVSTGAAMAKIDDDNIYVMGGNSSTSFWRYLIPWNAWIPFNTAYLDTGAPVSQDGLVSQGNSCSVTSGPDAATGETVFYVIPTTSSNFLKYTPSSNTWSELYSLPTSSSYGTAQLNIGNSIYYKPQYTTSFYRYDIATNSWTTRTSSPGTTRAGNNLAYPGSGDYIYALQGNNATAFYRYSISGNSWTTLATAPLATYVGASLAFHNSNDLYALRGNNSKNFWKYDVGTNTWDPLSSDQPPFVSNVQSGGSLVSDGTYVYAAVGTGSKEFWRYDPAAASGSRWYRFPSTTVGFTGDMPANMGYVSTSYQKGALTFCDDCGGTGLDEIWAVTGNGVIGYSINDNAGLLFRFRIDPVTCDTGGENPGTGSSPCNNFDSWVHYPKPAVVPASVTYGGALTYPGTGNLLYSFSGNSNAFRAYDMLNNSWIPLSTAPGSVTAGAALASYNNGSSPDIYALQGGGNLAFWLYRVTNPATGAGSWNPVDPTDPTGTGFASGGSLVYDGTGNFYASRGNATNQILRYNIVGDSWSSLSPLGASLDLPTPLFIGQASNTTTRGGLAYTASGPSGGAELFMVTGVGNSGNSFATPLSWAGLLYRYPLDTGVNVGTWPLSDSPAPEAPATIGAGGALTSTDSDSIFAFRGTNTSSFYRFDISSNIWSSPTSQPTFSIGAGGALTNNGVDTLYATSGNLLSNFYKYTISAPSTGNGSWNELVSSPVPISNNSSNSGGGLVYTDLLLANGDETVWMVPYHGVSYQTTTNTAQLLYRYDVATDSWPHFAKASIAPGSTVFSAGSDLALSTDNATIYALRGTEASYSFGGSNWSVTNPNFWKYTIATDTWAPLTNVYNNSTPKRVFSGGSITAAALTPDTLYVATGGSSKDILKYSISTDSWVIPANFQFPYAIGTLVNTTDGGELIYSPSSEKLFATTGTDTTTPYTIYYLDLANRAVPTLNSALATTQSAFDILVTATDRDDNAVNVTQDTEITLSLKSGSGELRGTLTGTILSGQSSVLISGVTYNTVESSITITATDTSASPTLVPFDISFPVYGPTPTITNISPNSGSNAGGNWVTITGSGFVDGTYATFDGIGASDVDLVNSGELRVLVPAVGVVSLPSAIDVAIVNPSGQSVTASGGYTFVAPSITSVSPDSAGANGNTTITISGTNFGPSHFWRELTVTNSNAELSDYPISFTFDSAALITAGKMRPDCGDLRLLDSGPGRQLNYWIQDDTCNTATTTVWVKVPTLPNGGKSIYLTHGDFNLSSNSSGNSVFQFFDDFESATLDTGKWTSTTGSPSLLGGKLILNNSEGIFAGGYAIPSNTVWETSHDPVVTSRYSNVLKGAATTTAAWDDNTSSDSVAISLSSSSILAESLSTDTSMGTYAVGSKPYRIHFRPNDANLSEFFYNNGAATTIVGTDAPDRLYPSLYVSSGNFEATWDYIFIRPYGGATEPAVAVGSENGGMLQVIVNNPLVGDVPATNIELLDSSTIRAVTHAVMSGTYSLSVINFDANSNTQSGAIDFGSPSITSALPDTVTTAGNTEITINGSNFVEGGYYRSVFISNNSGETLENQQLYFTLDTATLIGAAKMQTACQDVRVRDSDHSTALNHWVESCNSTMSHVWVEIPSIPPAGKYIYLHYGNPNFVSAASTESFFPTLASANNVLWLKADNGITLNGSTVSAWADSSGSGNTVAQATATYQPLYNVVTQFGIPSISFDGSNDFLNRTGFFNLPTGAASRSGFVVARYDRYGYGGFTYGNNATSAAFGMMPSSNSTYGYLGVQNYSGGYFSSTTLGRSLYLGILLHEAILDGTTLNQWKNGAPLLTSTSTSFNTATTTIEIGREIDNSPYINMDLFEVVLFDKALTSSERIELETYFNLKYNLNNDIQTRTHVGAEQGQSTAFDLYFIDSVGNVDFSSIDFIDSTSLRAVTPAHAVETVDLQFIAPDSSASVLLDGLSFSSPPTISSINPTTGTNGEILSVDVIGTEITVDTEILLSRSGQSDIVCSNYSNVTSTTLTCDLDLRNARVGFWDVEIYTPGITPGAGSSLPLGFEITVSSPVIYNLSPPGGSTLGGTAVTITGDYFLYKGGNYTTPIDITNSGAEQTDYQVRFTMDTATAIAAGKMRSDCGDIRIYNDAELYSDTSIPYYLESGCNTSSTVIWAKVPTVAATATTTIYVNYGVPDRTGISSGNDVFIFFDDFEGGTIDLNKWTPGGTVNWVIETADYFQGLFSSKNPTLSSYQNSEISSKEGLNLITVPTGRNAVIDFYWKISAASNYSYMYYCTSADDITYPACSDSSGYINRITGSVAWTREQNTSAPLSEGVYRFKAGFYRGYYSGGSNTSWLDAVKVRLYSNTVADGVAGTEVTAENTPIVTFDTTDSSSVTYVDSSTLIAIAPAHAAGPVDITVTNPDSQFDVSPTQFNYAAPPSLTSVNPNNELNTNSALTITIYGTDLVATPTAKLTKDRLTDIPCTNPRNFVDGSPDSFQCDLDLNGKDIGSYDLVVTNPDLQTATLVEGFEVVPPPPVLSSIDPIWGTTLGGTFVTVTGQNFYSETGQEGFSKSVTVSNTGTAQSNYQYNFLIDTASLISAGKMRSDCGDIRVFADENFSTPIPYYLESGCNSSSTSIWTKIPTIAASGDTTFYLTYGQPDLTSASNGNDVFILFDNFEGGSIDSAKWDVGGSASWMIDNTDKYEGTYSSRGGDISDSQDTYIASKAGLGLINVPTNHSAIIDFYWKVSSESNYDFLFYCTASGDSTLPSCTRSSGYIYRITGTINWGREQSSARTSGILSSGLHRLKFAYGKDSSASSGSDTGWIDLVRVRLYSSNVNTTPTYGNETALANPIKVSFGGQLATDLNLVNSTTIELLTPPGSGIVDVTVTNPDAQSDTLTAAYTYVAPPSITSIIPDYGHNEQSITGVIINGANFVDAPTARISLGRTSIFCTNLTYVDSTQLTCDLDLNGATVGFYNVEVINPDLQVGGLEAGFEVTLAPPEITDIDPDFGFASGGTVVTITGDNFVDTPSVYFGANPAASVTFISDTTIEAETPAGTGTVDVTVTNPDTQSDVLTSAFTYVPAPSVRSIVPNTGHNQESLTGVVVNGANFVATPTVTLYLGETPLSCTNVSFIGSTQLTCDLDLNEAFVGSYNVVVRNPDTQTGSLSKGFDVTYPQPTITDIDPSIGLVAGGELIIITGTYFEDGADVDFDGVYSSLVTYLGPTQLEVETPPHTIGLKDVTVTNPNLMSVTAIDGYEYIDPPLPTSIVPNSGSNDLSSYTVTIYGSNFVSPSAAKLSLSGQSDITCSNIRNFIDNIPPTDDSFQCDLNLNGVERGQWDLSMTNGNGQVGSLEDAFTVTFAPPTVSSITPDEVATGTTESVTIFGTNFYSEDPDFIEATIGGTGGVGGTICTTPVVVNSSTLTCNLPPLAAGTYDVTVTTGTGSDTLENTITYFDPPTISLVDPNSGSTTGGTAITITGTNFFGTPTVFMTHTPLEETTATDVIVVNPTTITAVTPPSTEGPVDVTVVTGGGSDTLEDGFTYIPPPADPEASTIEIFAYRIEQINPTYYQESDLSPMHASLIRVRAIESLTGNLIVGREVNLEPDPATDLLIRSTGCSNIYDIGATGIATTDTWGTACFLVWSTGPSTFDAASSTIGATIAAGASSNAVTIEGTVNLEIEPLAMTSVLNYRFRNDDGSELTATPIADTSTPLYQALNGIGFRLRLGITRLLEQASSFARNDEFALSGRAQIGPRPLPAGSPEGISSLRAFPGFAIDEETSTLYLATPNRADSKARIYRYSLTDLTLPPTNFEFPATVNFSPATPDDIDAPIDGGTHLISRMFIDSENDLMYFVLTPYFDDTGLTRLYKVDLLTGTVIDVFAQPVISAKSSLDAEIDLDNGFLYLTVGTPVIMGDPIVYIGVQKISLNGRTEAMNLVGELQLENSQTFATSSLIDLTNQFLYVSGGYPQKIFKIDLNVDPSLAPVKVDEIALVPLSSTSPDETVGIQASVIDPVEGFAYFAGSTDFNAPGYDEANQKAFLTKVDIDPTRTFEVISRLSLNPPSLTADYDFHGEYVYLPPFQNTERLYGYASIDRVNGYAYLPLGRQNRVRNTYTWKLMRIHLDTFTRDSVYDELLFPEVDSTSIKGTTFFPAIGRGYLVREMTDGDWLYEFNSTTRQNFKLQSSPNVDPLYCNYASNDLYTWSDIPNTDFELVDSTNITDGDPTSNVTGLLYDNNTYFRAGEMKDGSATTGRISLGQNEFTEIEYSLAPTSNASGSYCLRLVDADPLHQNQVSGYPNLLYNIITPQFNPTTYHHYVPVTINGVELEKNEINVVEGSSSDSYGIRLTSQPTDDVTITINAIDSRLILSPDETPLTPQETTVTFDDTNWNTWQYVNTAALDNGIIDGTSIDLITHSSASADPGYDNIIIEPVQSIVTDYGATIANVLATVSGTITFTPPTDFSFPDVNTGASEPNFSPTLTVSVEEGRGTVYDFVLTLQTDGFCRTQTVCLPLERIFIATSALVNSFNTFNAAEIAQFMANYLQDGQSLTDRTTYVHAEPTEDRSLAAPITLFDSRNVPSGNSDNPLQGSSTFGLNLMIDFANITGLTAGNYRTLLSIDLNTNPL